MCIRDRNKRCRDDAERRRDLKNGSGKDINTDEFEMCIRDRDFPVSVSVSIVNDRQIHRLNKKYRGIDSSTDVLSFPLLEDGCPTPDDIDYDSGCIPLGDIVISIDHAVMQARDYGHSLRREIAFLCVHSVLHLLGYDHVTSDEDERIMFDKQREILGSMGITR